LTELLSGSGDAVAGRCVNDAEMMQLLTVCAPDLHWRPAGFGKLPQQIRQKIAVVELLGPSGMYFHADVRCGLLIQCADVQYPRHWHAAEELYLVIKGTAHWTLDENTPVPRAPGAFVHHPSLQPHGMTTRAEPMLALWGWTGDIDGASYAL
jgi:dimethylpropiothetin dethiomethylase